MERNVTPSAFNFSLKPKTIAIVVVVVVILGSLMSSLYMVDETEKAVILRFGEYSSTASSGLNYKLPFGIDRVYKVPIKVQDMYFGYRTSKAGVITQYSSRDFPEESIMLTGDLNIVDIEWSIQYQITDPKAWLFNVENREKTIRDISQSVINTLVGDRAILDVIGSERESIRIEAKIEINELLSHYNLGAQIVEIQLQNTRPPEGAVFDAFQDVNVATQDMNRLINEGKEQYNREIPRVQGQADKMILEAEGYASRRVNEADGDVARFKAVLGEYRKNPEVTRNRLYIEMMEEVFTEAQSTDLVDKNLENFLPLKNLTAGEAR